MRLKDIKDKFFVLEHANKIYNIYDYASSLTILAKRETFLAALFL